MTVDVETTANNLKTLLSEMATPGTTPMFGDVWIGAPKQLPMETNRAATIQAVEEYDFTDNVCPTHYDNTCLFYVNIESAGTVTIANLDVYACTKLVKTAIKTTPDILGGCVGSKIIGVKYGEMAGSDDKRLTALGRVDVECKYSY